MKYKTNIGLKIINQKPNNYHNIETVFQELEFHDVITITKTNKEFQLSSNNQEFPISNSNTCAQAYFSIKKEFPDLELKLQPFLTLYLLIL